MALPSISVCLCPGTTAPAGGQLQATSHHIVRAEHRFLDGHLHGIRQNGVDAAAARERHRPRAQHQQVGAPVGDGGAEGHGLEDGGVHQAMAPAAGSGGDRP